MINHLTRRQSLWMLAGGIASAAGSPLEEEWRKIASASDGTVGAAALHFGFSRSATSLNGDQHFPLMSVCKLPIAMHMLALVDDGKLTRDAMIEVLPRDVVKSVSPLAERWPKERRFPLGEMLALMVAQSDNTAVETFFRMEGPAISARLRAWQISGIRIDRSERQCGRDRHANPQKFLEDPRDTGTPAATVDLLARLFRGELLSAASTTRMIEILKSTTTGAARLKGMLPPGTVVAHKTGSSGTENGFAAATNDSGVIFLPNGGQLAVSVYCKASKQKDEERDALIARIALAAYEAYR